MNKLCKRLYEQIMYALNGEVQFGDGDTLTVFYLKLLFGTVIKLKE